MVVTLAFHVLPPAVALPSLLTLPPFLFEQNIGQYPPDIVFVHDQLTVYRESMLFNWLSVRFPSSSATAQLVFSDPAVYPLRYFAGLGGARRFENIPQFSTVRQLDLYPGIDVVWHSNTNFDLVVSPGADLSAIRLRIDAENIQYVFSGGGITIRSPYTIVIGAPSLAQTALLGQSNPKVSFLEIEPQVFGLNCPSCDQTSLRTLQFTINARFRSPALEHVRPALDGGYLYTGIPECCSRPARYLIKTTANDATPLFITMMDGISPTWIASHSDGSTTVAGNTDASLGLPPTTASAPRPAPPGNSPTGWVGRFDARGMLLAATFLDSRLDAFTSDAFGNTFLLVSSAVLKWIPGQHDFSWRVSEIPNIVTLSANNAGQLAFAAPIAPALPVTTGSFQLRYTGPQDVYTGIIDSTSGRPIWTTYIPINGAPLGGAVHSVNVALSPHGAVWLASQFAPGPVAQPYSHTLVAVAPDGRRVLRSLSLPALPKLSFDTGGNTLAALSTAIPNLPTTPNAVMRAACKPRSDSAFLYLMSFSPNGQTSYVSYLESQSPNIETFDNLRLLTFDDTFSFRSFREVSSFYAAEPAVRCIVHTAAQTYSAPSRDGQYTLVGSLFGLAVPPSAATPTTAPVTQINGLEVKLNGEPLPLISVDQGLVTFYVPERVTATTFDPHLEVVWPGGSIRLNQSINTVPDFALLATDGSGMGAAAALNEDGSINSVAHPARWGSVVSIFGTGALPNPMRVVVDAFPATVEFAGPAPISYPGVKQINVRLPKLSTDYSGWMDVRVGVMSRDRLPLVIYVAP